MTEAKKPKINKRLLSVLLAVMILIASLAVAGTIAFASLTDYRGNALNSSIDKQVNSVVANGNYQIGDARSMLQLINKMRTGKDAWYWNDDNKTKTVLSNVGTLKYDYALEQIAMRRAAELVLSFAHQRPDGTMCFDILYDGIGSWGENIAYCYGYGDSTTQLIFESWAEENYGYEGQGHRRNMLNPSFTAVGIACFKYNGTYYWVQEFGYSTSKVSDPIGTFYAAPKLSSATADSNGVTVKWGNVAGATKYRVFYKANGESTWHKAGDTTSTSFTWTKAKSGTKYAFTVRCVDKDGKTFTSPYDKTGKALTYVSAPKLSSVENTATGVKISWAKSAGAEKYRVFYKTAGGSWTKITDTASTSYVWKGAKSGTKYAFTVRCINGKASAYTSGYDPTGKSITYVAAPKLSSVTNTATGVKISWAKPAGAVKYRVFYKANGESTWHKAGDTTATSFTWTKAKSGTKYTFTVRCISKDGKAFTSGYDTTGKAVTFLSAPKVTVSKTSSGIKVSWGKVTGAVNYKIYRKTANGSYEPIGTSTGTSFVDKKAKSGTKYIYTVRCVSKDGKTTISSYNAGKSITR